MDRGFGRTAAAILLFIAGVACLVFLVYSLANDLSNWVLGSLGRRALSSSTSPGARVVVLPRLQDRTLGLRASDTVGELSPTVLAGS